MTAVTCGESRADARHTLAGGIDIARLRGAGRHVVQPLKFCEQFTRAPYRRHQVRRRFFAWSRQQAKGTPQMLAVRLPLERKNASLSCCRKEGRWRHTLNLRRCLFSAQGWDHCAEGTLPLRLQPDGLAAWLRMLLCPHSVADSFVLLDLACV